MQRAHSLEAARALKLGPTALAIGIFDGVHVGHAALLRRCVQRAQAQGLRACALTFDPHPAKCLRPEQAPPSVESIEARLAHFAALGFAAAVVLPFDHALAAQPADVFVDQVVGDVLQARHVVVGQDFAYGRRAAGNVHSLAAHGAKGAGATHTPFQLETVAPVQCLGATASSTRVRRAIADGALDEAQALLGRRYALTGTVEGGLQRGRTLGFPTANLARDAELVPAFGVYATWVQLPFGRFAAATSIGVHPTFDAAPAPKVESYLLDYRGDAFYGARMRVELVDRLRGEARFADVQALLDQMHADCAQARRCLGLPPAPP